MYNNSNQSDSVNPDESEIATPKWLDMQELGDSGTGKWGVLDTILTLGLGVISMGVLGAIYFFVRTNNILKYIRKKKFIEEVQTQAYKKTGSSLLASALHKGGIPYLPYNTRIVMGFNKACLTFYNYSLEELFSVGYGDLQSGIDTRNITMNGFGTTYTPKNSTLGTTLTTNTISMSPDTLKIATVIKGEVYVSEFDVRPYNALEFVQLLNQRKLTD